MIVQFLYSFESTRFDNDTQVTTEVFAGATGEVLFSSVDDKDSPYEPYYVVSVSGIEIAVSKKDVQIVE